MFLHRVFNSQFQYASHPNIALHLMVDGWSWRFFFNSWRLMLCSVYTVVSASMRIDLMEVTMCYMFCCSGIFMTITAYVVLWMQVSTVGCCCQEVIVQKLGLQARPALNLHRNHAGLVLCAGFNCESLVTICMCIRLMTFGKLATIVNKMRYCTRPQKNSILNAVKKYTTVSKRKTWPPVRLTVCVFVCAARYLHEWAIYF